MLYHPILNSSSGILRAAYDADKSTIYLEFAGKEINSTYAYTRDSEVFDFNTPDVKYIVSERIWQDLTNVKALANSLTDTEKVELQLKTPYTLGSEGSFCLKTLVGPRKDPYPNRKLTPDEAAEVWAEMNVAPYEPLTDEQIRDIEQGEL